MEPHNVPWYPVVPQQHWANQLANYMAQMVSAIMAMGMANTGIVYLQREWLSPADRDRLVKKYGYWAVRRAESMIPSSKGVAVVEASAKHQLNLYEKRLARPPRTTRARKTEEAGEEIKATGELNPEDCNELIADAREWVGAKMGRKLTEEAIRDLAKENYPNKLATERTIKYILEGASK